MVVAAAGVDFVVRTATDECVVSSVTEERAGKAGLVANAIIAPESLSKYSLDVALIERLRLSVQNRLHFRATELDGDAVVAARADDAEYAVAVERCEAQQQTRFHRFQLRQ